MEWPGCERTIDMIEASNRSEDHNRSYTVEQIAVMLSISKRSAYELCAGKPIFKVIRFGRSVRVHKESFDRWFNHVGDEYGLP